MPSPFPGMNPYLEQTDVWHDFHQRFISRIGDCLAGKIQPAYVTKIDENVYIHELSAAERYLLGRPDIAVLGGEAATVNTSSSSAVMPLAIGRLLPATERISEPFIEIRDIENRDLVTVIELLSPTNKNSGPDREQYLSKRRIYLTASVNFVEIDLLRGGARMPVEGLPQCDYSILVSRYWQRPEVGLWPLKLPQRLPRIPIPLKPEHGEVVIDLQQLLDVQYDATGYANYIYRGTPRPPLHPDDLVWARQFMPS